jgi:hypothetical protein
MANAVALKKKVKVLVSKYGTDATLYAVSGAFDPATNSRTTTETSETVKVSPPTPEGNAFEGSGNTTPQQDETRYISADGLTTAPAPGMRLEIAGASKRIVTVEAYKLSGVAIAYGVGLAS